MKTDNNKWITIAIIGLMTFALAIPLMGISVGVTIQPEPCVAYTSAILYGDFDNVLTWGGGGFPGSGDTWTILNTHTVNVTGEELSGSGTVNAGGTLHFNCTGGAAVLTLDNGATLQNDGTVNESGSTLGNFAALVGVSLEPFTNGDIDWVDGFWRISQLNYQVALTTGGGGCRIDIDDTCEFDAVTIAASDTFDANAETVQIGGNWDSKAGTFITVGGTFQSIANININTEGSSTGGEFGAWTVDAGTTSTLISDIYALGLVTINGDLIAGANKIVYPNYDGTLAIPLVLGGASDITDAEISLYIYVDAAVEVPAMDLGGNLTAQPIATDGNIYEYKGDLTIGGNLTMNGTAASVHDMLTNTIAASLPNIFANFTLSNGSSAQLGASIEVNNSIVVSHAVSYFEMGYCNITVPVDWNSISTSASWDVGVSNTTFNGTGFQNITTSQPFYNVSITNTGASDITMIGDLDVNGTLNCSSATATLRLDTGGQDVYTTGNVSLGVGFTVTHGSGTWTFDGTTAYNDENVAPEDIGNASVTSTLNLLSDIHVGNMNISAAGVFALDNRTIIIDGPNLTIISGGSYDGITNYNTTFGTDVNITDGSATPMNLGNVSVTGVATMNSDIRTENYTVTGVAFPSANTLFVRGNITLATAMDMDDATLDMNGTIDQGIIWASGNLENLVISNSGTEGVILSQDMTLGNLTTSSTTCTFNISVALNLTITTDILLTVGTTIEMGTSGWNISGALAQSITSGGHTFPTMRITNTDADITFTDDTNITTMNVDSDVSLVLTDDMTIGTLTTVNDTWESSNLLLDRFLFVPLANRTITNTSFNKVNLVPPAPSPPGGGALPVIPEPAQITEPADPEPEGTSICASTIFMLGIVFGGGGITLFKLIKDPRRNGKC